MGGDRGRDRLVYIDALRGIAAFMVVFQHSLETVWAKLPHTSRMWSTVDALLHTVNLGRLGVIVFFLISGFVIPFSLERGLRSFALTRFFRLYPAFWLCIAIGLLLGPVLGEAGWSRWQVLVNLTMLQRLVHVTDFYSQFWTLSYEMLFYGLCALLFILGLLRSAAVIGAVTVAFLLLGDLPPLLGVLVGHPVMRWHEPPIFLPFLFLGTLLRMAIVEQDAVAGKLVKLIVPLTAISCPIFADALSPGPGMTTFLRPLPATMGFLGGLALFLAVPRLIRLPRRLAVLGTISYSVYLFQTIVIDLTMQVMPPVDGAAAIFFIGAVLLGAAASGWLVYNLVEAPMIALGRSLAHQRRSLATEIAP